MFIRTGHDHMFDIIDMSFWFNDLKTCPAPGEFTE